MEGLKFVFLCTVSVLQIGVVFGSCAYQFRSPQSPTFPTRSGLCDSYLARGSGLGSSISQTSGSLLPSSSVSNFGKTSSSSCCKTSQTSGGLGLNPSSSLTDGYRTSFSQGRGTCSTSNNNFPTSVHEGRKIISDTILPKPSYGSNFGGSTSFNNACSNTRNQGMGGSTYPSSISRQAPQLPSSSGTCPNRGSSGSPAGSSVVIPSPQPPCENLVQKYLDSLREGRRAMGIELDSDKLPSCKSAVRGGGSTGYGSPTVTKVCTGTTNHNMPSSGLSSSLLDRTNALGTCTAGGERLNTGSRPAATSRFQALLSPQPSFPNRNVQTNERPRPNGCGLYHS